MAKLTPNGSLIGKVGILSYYKMRGVEGTIVRTKGGPSKSKIKKSPNFEIVRKNNREFGARSTVSRNIMAALNPHKIVADHNIAGPVHSLLRKVQLMDDKSEVGKRNIQVSRMPQLFQGFSLNRKHPFDSIVRTPLQYHISGDDVSGVVEIPALLPGINFVCPFFNPMFRVSACLGMVGDHQFVGGRYYTPPICDGRNKQQAQTAWFPVATGSAPQVLTMKLVVPPPDQHFILLLSMAIFLGNVASEGNIQQVPYVGAAKVLAVL